MPDRTYIYKIEVDASSAGPSAAQARAVIQQQLGQIKFTPQAVMQPTGSPSSIPNLAPGGSSGGSFGVRDVLGLSIGGFAVKEMAQAAIQAGTLGAQNVRLARSYGELAKSVGLAGDSLLTGLGAATQHTVTDQKLMASTNLLLADAQAGQIKVTEQQIETLARFARLRSTQLTQGGEPISTEDVYDKLIKGVAKGQSRALSELGINLKDVSDQLGVPTQEITKDTQSLLNAVVQIGNAQVKKFGDPVVDEATKIEQAATRIEQSKNRINAALAGPVAAGYSFVGDTIDFLSKIPQGVKNAPPTDQETLISKLTQNPEDTAGFLRKRGQSAMFGADDFTRTAQLVTDANSAMMQGKQGSDALAASVNSLALEMANAGIPTKEEEERLNALSVQARLVASDGIRVNDANKQMGDSAGHAAEKFVELAGAIYKVGEAGEYIKMPTFGPMPNPNPTPYTPMQQGVFGGTLLGSIMQGGPDALQQRIGSLSQQKNEKDSADTERVQQEAVRKNEQAWESAASKVEQAWRGAASSFEDQIRGIPGLFSNSQVTSDQLDLAKMGVPQNFVDDFRRQLDDQVLNNVSHGIDEEAAFGSAGIDPKLPRLAKDKIYDRMWDDSSLFANPDNVKYINQSAAAAELNRQQMSKIGQENLASLFGVGEDGQGAYFKGFEGLGGTIAGGMKMGAQDSLHEFAQDAIANVTMQLKSDAALSQYAGLGGSISDAMWGGFIDNTASTDFVGAITAAVMAQINDQLPPTK